MILTNFLNAQNEVFDSEGLSICNEKGKLKSVVLEDFLILNFQDHKLNSFYSKDSSFYSNLDSNIFYLRSTNKRFAIIKLSKDKISIVCRDTSVEISTLMEGEKQEGIGAWNTRVDSFWISCSYTNSRLGAIGIHYQNYMSSTFNSEFMTFGYLIQNSDDKSPIEISFRLPSIDLKKPSFIRITRSNNKPSPYSIDILNPYLDGLELLDKDFKRVNARFNLIRQKFLVNIRPLTRRSL
jgi:hypothetical protein